MDEYKKKVKDQIYSRFHLSVLNKESHAESTAFNIVNKIILNKFKQSPSARKRIIEHYNLDTQAKLFEKIILRYTK